MPTGFWLLPVHEFDAVGRLAWTATPTGGYALEYPAVHSTVHTNTYYQTVNQMLGAATTRAEAEAALGAIRQALLSGGM